MLEETPGMKAKEVAKKLKLEKTLVNSQLYAHPLLFQVDADYRWFHIPTMPLSICLFDGWVTADSFEASLGDAGSPWDTGGKTTIFFPRNCKVMIEAIARVLALSNQLAAEGKKIGLEFAPKSTAYSYLNRVGFFDHLDARIEVIPSRPRSSSARINQGGTDFLVEIAIIDPLDPDIEIPIRLKNSLVSCAGENYSKKAFTLISELFGNVDDHSKSQLPGFAGLQTYRPKDLTKVQIVISDHGEGIAGTLFPILEEKYPEIYKRLGGINPDADLVLEVFKRGQLSSINEDGRGLGLKRSGDIAAHFDAIVSVRQARFELIMEYEGGKLKGHRVKPDLVKLSGTHISLNFLIDS